MAEFVYAGGTLPDGKVNARPLTGDPTKGITATEWNGVMQALKDLRTALLAVSPAAGQVDADTITPPITGGGGGIDSLGAVGSSPNADGASISGSTLTLQPASASFPGIVTTDAQAWSGDKTLKGNLTLDGGPGKVTGTFRADQDANFLYCNANFRCLANVYVDGTITAAGTFRAINGIGVGNSADAATPGTVVKKMEVFDASGTSLGFVPIYDAIT